MQFPRGITGAKISNTFHLVELNEANFIKSKATKRGGDNPVLIRRKPNTAVFYPGARLLLSVTAPGLERILVLVVDFCRAQTERISRLSSAHFGIHYARINFNGAAGGADYNRSVIVLIRLRGGVRRGGGSEF